MQNFASINDLRIEIENDALAKIDIEIQNSQLREKAADFNAIIKKEHDRHTKTEH